MAKYKKVICAWCKKEFDKETKRINQTNKLHKRHTCSRACASRLINEQRRCEPSTDKAISTRKDKEKFPEKDHARSLVRHAIKSGKLTPIDECELCGEMENIEGHHPDHSRPFLLVYLCKECHIQADSSPDKFENLATDYSSGV